MIFNLMKDVLETTKAFVDAAQSVHINKERVVEFARGFDHGSVRHWLDAAPFDFTQLNFCYWGELKWTVEHEGRTYDGAWGMVLALGRAIHEKIPILDLDYCAQLDKKIFSHILRANNEIPLLEERYAMIRAVALVVSQKYQGKAENILKEASGDALRLPNTIIENFITFRDTSFYNGKEIYFYKRAQLLVADIYQLFDGEGFGALKNIDQITACADYKLPQILRKYGMLTYDARLVQKVDNQVEILHDSREEIEIRASTIWAVDYIKEEVRKKNPRVLSLEINDHLWLATQEKFLDDEPYHRTRTTAY